jgi:hypothetical protein
METRSKKRERVRLRDVIVDAWLQVERSTAGVVDDSRKTRIALLMWTAAINLVPTPRNLLFPPTFTKSGPLAGV